MMYRPPTSLLLLYVALWKELGAMAFRSQDLLFVGVRIKHYRDLETCLGNALHF